MATGTKRPPSWLVRSAHRSNPCIDLEVDVLAVERVAACSTKDEWNAGTKSTTHAAGGDVGVDAKGIVRLAENPTPTTIFEQAAGAAPPARLQNLRSSSASRPSQYAMCFFPDPVDFNGTAFVLDSVQFYARRQTQGVGLTVHVEEFDENWVPHPISHPIHFTEAELPLQVTQLLTLDFRDKELFLTIEPAFIRTNTGPGRTNAGALRELNKDGLGVSHIRCWKGFAIVFTPVGPQPNLMAIGTLDPAAGALFDITTYWRTTGAAAREHGPYDPSLRISSPLDTTKNTDDFLITGAVPGDNNQAPHYGALANGTGFGLWGIARRVLTAQDEHDTLAGSTNEQPWHRVRAVAYWPTGTMTKVLDLGAVPVEDVQIRLDDWTPPGTTLTYALRGSNISATGAWTTIGAVQDGDEIKGAGVVRRSAITGEETTVIAGSFKFRWYELVATFGASTGNFMSPALQSWFMVERKRFATYRHLKDFDSEVTADPVTGEAKIQELKLSIMRLGPRNFRDLATRIATRYSTSRLEAEVYVASTRDRSKRYYLNSFRLEQRDPKEGSEEFTFLSGLDRLKAHVPPKVETFSYPADGTLGTIASVTLRSGLQYTIAVTGATFPTSAPTLAGYSFDGKSGNFAQKSKTIDASPANTATQFDVTFDQASDIPAAGDKFEIHSNVFQRQEKLYTSQDFAAIYADVFENQLRVPSRYRGRKPEATGHSATGRLSADGRPGKEVLAELALHAGTATTGTEQGGGLVGWLRGRISYIDIYGTKAASATWDERHYESLETPTGGDRRMPAIVVKYGYDLIAKRFTNEATIRDANAMLALGLPNLFDESSPFSEEFSKWNNADEARRMGELFRAAWSTGVRIWKVKLVHHWPWLEIGDAVSILTSQYTDRRPNFLDGVNDSGTPIAGRIAALGVIVGHNLWGTEFLLAVRGLGAIESGPGVGTLGVSLANPTYGAPIGQAGQITYPFTLDYATAYIEVWSTEYGSDPGAVVSRENVGTKVDTIRRGDGRSAIVLATTSSNWRLTTFVAFDSLSLRGTAVTVKTQATGTAPGAPGTPTAVSNTTSSVTNRVPTNASSTTAWKIRTYRNGVQWGSDIAVVAGAGANQDVTHSGLDAGTSYNWEYSHVDGAGLESAKSALLTHATATGTLNAPTLDSLFRQPPIGGTTISGAWTPASGTPSGVTYELREAAATGGPYSAFVTTTATSGSGETTNAPVFCVVVATKPGYTDSPNSNERSV